MIAKGLIPFGIPRKESGRILHAKAFESEVGTCSVCYGHWLNNDYRFVNNGIYFVTAEGLNFLHFLDVSRPFEAEIANMIKSGTISLSHGTGKSPEATREAVSRYLNRNVKQIYFPYKASDRTETFDHISYTRDSAYFQEPVKLF